MAKANSNNATLNQNVTAEDIADAEAQAFAAPPSEDIKREQIGSAIVETNNAYVEDNTGKPISAPAAEWVAVEEIINGMKVTTYTDPVGGWPEESR